MNWDSEGFKSEYWAKGDCTATAAAPATPATTPATHATTPAGGQSGQGKSHSFGACTSVSDCANPESCCMGFNVSEVSTTLSPVRVCVPPGTNPGPYVLTMGGGITPAMVDQYKRGWFRMTCPAARAPGGDSGDSGSGDSGYHGDSGDSGYHGDSGDSGSHGDSGAPDFQRYAAGFWQICSQDAEAMKHNTVTGYMNKAAIQKCANDFINGKRKFVAGDLKRQRKLLKWELDNLKQVRNHVMSGFPSGKKGQTQADFEAWLAKDGNWDKIAALQYAMPAPDLMGPDWEESEYWAGRDSGDSGYGDSGDSGYGDSGDSGYGDSGDSGQGPATHGVAIGPATAGVATASFAGMP